MTEPSKFLAGAFSVLFLALSACAPPPAVGPAETAEMPTAVAVPTQPPPPAVPGQAYPELSRYIPPTQTDSMGRWQAQRQLVPPDPATQPVRLGLLLPLSGPEAAVGQTLLHAAQLALFDFADPRLVLLPQDTRGTAAGAQQAAIAAIQKGAQLLLGPVFADAVMGAATPAREAGVNMIAFSTDRQVAGNGVFLLSLMAEQEVARIIRYAASQQITHFAAAIPDSAYGARVAEAFRLAVAQVSPYTQPRMVVYPADLEAMHDPIKRLANYDERRRQLLAELERLQQSSDPAAKRLLAQLEKRETLGDVDFEAVLIPEGGATLRALAPLLPYYEIDPGKVRFLGTGLWNEPLIHREPPLVGGWFPAPPPGASRDFEDRMMAIYGSPPPPIAGLAYDALALAAVLAQRGGEDMFSRAALTNPDGFAGILGIFRLRPDGLSERGLTVLQVNRKGPEIVDPAPTRFVPVFN